MKEDIFIRDYIKNNFKNISIYKIEIKRKSNFININIYVSKSSVLVIGTTFNLVNLQKNLSEILEIQFSSRNVNINLLEVLNPDSNAIFLADFARQQLEKRVPFRKVIKTTLAKAQKGGVKGIKFQFKEMTLTFCEKDVI